MEESVLSGKGHRFENIPRDTWEKHVMLESQHMPAVLDFMTKEHHLVRNLVVKEIARTGKPVSPEEISVTLATPKSKIIALLDDLERNLFFLVRDDAGKVTWAFPVTTAKTPHQMTFNTGEKIHAA